MEKVVSQNAEKKGVTSPLIHTRIRPPSGWEALDLSELWQFRDLFVILMMRDVKLRYKQTALGVAWVILQPLISAIIFAVVFGRLADLPSNGVPYLLFAYAGMLGWNIFANGLQRSGTSLVTSARMISKVYFPRLTIPIASTASVLVDFLVAIVVMFILIAIEGYQLTANALVFPVFVVMTLVFTVGVSLWISSLSVYYRDFGYSVPFIIQAWLYISPVAYSTELVPERYQVLYSLNPMTGVLEGFRWSLLGTSDFPGLALLMGGVVSVTILLSGAFVFRRIENHFADVV